MSTNSSKHRESIIIPELNEKRRLKEYGVGLFIGAATRSALKKALKNEWITIDGRTATTASYVQGGEQVCLTIPNTKKTDKKLVLPLQVLYEDDYLAIINKPAGILVSGNRFVTVAAGLAQNLSASSRQDGISPHPVHRLDYATTGALLVGKTAAAIRSLMKMFEAKEIKKTYLAIAIGSLPKTGIFNSPIDEKPALSSFRLIDHVDSERFTVLSLVELLPQTGRRHQLRKHLFESGHPILGDKDYFLEGKLLNGKGLYLHAHSLEFQHPFTRETIKVDAPIPAKFKKIFNQL